MSEMTIIDEMLAEQQRLTPVERFARRHEAGKLPAQARYYQELIPLTRPGPDEQYAFGVDLDICTGCKACVSACHSLNGLGEEEIWRNVGLIHGGTVEEPYQQTITTACHHCVDPGCMNGCPVNAYEKDEATGIVRHLDDQCIGCQYCMLKCPYDVPKYSERLGIVRKCDMCYHRLAADEAPACVQACPNEAITIRIVCKSRITAEVSQGDRLVPGAFDSEYTKPTTLYTTARQIPANTRPANAHRLRLEHAHWPLVWMLVLTQWAAGMFVLSAGLAYVAPAIFSRAGIWATLLALAILNMGLLVSVLHLGRPLGAWRFFLGLRKSWMSREILAFGLFAGAASAFTLASFWPWLKELAPTLAWADQWLPLALWQYRLGGLTAMTALAGVVCSAMIYIDTQRPVWGGARTFMKFLGTTMILGAATLGAVVSWGYELPFRWYCAAAGYGVFLLYGWELIQTRADLGNPDSFLRRPARTLVELLGTALRVRAGLVLAAFAALAGAIFAEGTPAAVLATLFALLLAGNAVIERYCYFAAGSAPRMPGGIST